MAGSGLKKLQIAQRRRKLIDLIRENPDYNTRELAEVLGVNKGTVSRDLKKINEELNMQTTEDFMIHRNRILNEIHIHKKLCMERLQKLHHSPHQGSRWMEEWSKLLEKEIRILGVNAPDKMMIKHSQELTKEQKDAATNAALGVIEDNTAVIDITPKQIEHKNDKANDSSTGEHDKSVFKIA